MKAKAPVATKNIHPSSLSNGPPADILRNFYHTKRVGNYLVGRKLGEGSFAKVREGLHATTGVKVRFVNTVKMASNSLILVICYSPHSLVYHFV